MLIGAHTPSEHPLAEAEARNADLVQIFLSNPQGWKKPAHRAEKMDADLWREILLIDPHLSWWGPSRFWEVRWHAGNLVGSGVTLPGSPYIGLGHNEKVAWAMTTGGPAV